MLKAPGYRIETDHVAIRSLLAAAGILPLLVYGAVSIYLAARRDAAIGHHRQRKRRSARVPNRSAFTFKPTSTSSSPSLGISPTRTSSHGNRIEFSRTPFSTFRSSARSRSTMPPERRLPRVASANRRSQFPQSGTSFGPNITLSPIGIDDDFLPTAVVGIKLAQLGQSSGSLVGEISLEEMWRMVDRIRVGDQGFALVVAANGQLIAHGNSNEKPRVARGDNLARTAARAPRARPAQRGTRVARVRQRSRRADARRRRAARAARLDRHGRAAAQRSIRRRRRAHAAARSSSSASRCSSPSASATSSADRSSSRSSR